MKYAMGIDVGTGSLKTILMDETGVVVSEVSIEYTFRATPDGGAEQDPYEWVDACKRALQLIRNENNIDLHDIACICPTGMHRGLVLLGARGEALRDAIIWTDIRSAPQVKSLAEKYGDRIHDLTQNLITTAATLPRFVWLKENEPDIIEKTDTFLYPSNFIAYILTGKIRMDKNNASASLMYDMLNHRWSGELLDMTTATTIRFPELVSGLDLHGLVTAESARGTGLKEGTPVYAGIADASAELYSIGLKDDENCMIRLGSAGSLGFVTTREQLLNHKRNSCIEYDIYPEKYLDGNYILTCASAVKWTRNMFFSELEKSSEAFSIMDKEAADVPVGADGLMFHPFLLGENSPYYNPDIRAMFHGLTMSHERKNVVRAVYEGVSYCYKNIMDKSGAFDACKNIYIVGGGAKSALWLSVLVDVLGKPGVVPKYCDAAYGAVLMAGAAQGWWDTEELLKNNMKYNRVVSPNLDNTKFYNDKFPIFRKIAEDAIAGLEQK